jgi:hypothetical protein
MCFPRSGDPICKYCDIEAVEEVLDCGSN